MRSTSHSAFTTHTCFTQFLTQINNIAVGLCRYALVVGLLLTGLSASAQKTGFGGSLFSQFGNEPTKEQWIFGILNPNNSEYFEGTSTPQRLLLKDIPRTASGTDKHTLYFRVLATKSGINAYDFLVSYDQTKVDYDAITGTERPDLTPTVSGESTQGEKDLLAALYGKTGPFKALATAPTAAQHKGAVGTSKTTAYIVNKYDGLYPGDARKVQLYSDEEFVGTPVLRLMSYTNPDKDQDSYALYELEFEFKRGTTVTSPDLLLLMGGHLALSGQSGPVTLAEIRYDNSKGASFISGGPYHFKLDKLDGISLGNQDNQIQSGAITIFVASRCTLADNINTCAGSILDYSVSTNASGATITWTIQGSGTFVDASGAPTTPGNTTAVKVKASDVGTTAGTFTVTATITAPGFVGSSCSDVVTVNPLPTVTADDKPVCVGSTVQLTGSPSGGTWSGANVSGSTFNAAGLTAGTYTVTYSFTSAGGCTSTDNATITVNDLPTAGITGGTFCKNGTTQLSITSGPTTGTFSASPSGLSISSSGLINLAASTLGTYTVTYSFSDANSCSNTTTSSVTVNDQPGQPAVTVVQPSCSSMTGTVTVTSPVGPNVEYSNQGGAYQSEATFTFNAGQGYSIVARTKNTECKSAAAVCTPDPNYPVAGLKASTQLKQAVEAPEKVIQTEAYPNPTGSDATINFSVPKSGRVLVNVYNSMGKQVGVLFDGEVKAGEQRSVVMKGGALPTGTYYYRVTSHGKTQTNRISLAK